MYVCRGYCRCATCFATTMQLRIRAHINSLLDYPGRLEKELSERDAHWRSKMWDRTTCFAARGATAERRITRMALEKDQREEGKRKARKKERETKRLRHVYMCVRNNYPAYCRPLLPRKSLTSCWRAKKVRICCCGYGKKRRGTISLRRAECI